MNRAELEALIRNEYGCEPEYPWPDTPQHAVFRHRSNGKWFAIIMEIPRNKLGLEGTEPLDIVNFKCSPVLRGSFATEAGFFPAYHMNKEHWITAALDGSAPEEAVRLLLEVSFAATDRKTRRKTKQTP